MLSQDWILLLSGYILAQNAWLGDIIELSQRLQLSYITRKSIQIPNAVIIIPIYQISYHAKKKKKKKFITLEDVHKYRFSLNYCKQNTKADVICLIITYLGFLLFLHPWCSQMDYRTHTSNPIWAFFAVTVPWILFIFTYTFTNSTKGRFSAFFFPTIFFFFKIVISI